MSGTFRILDGVETPMRDGVVLRGDVWLPEGAAPGPVLLQRTPYRREDVHGAQFISALEFQSALRRGFAVMVQDTRGRFGSDGMFEPFIHEGRDGVDTIDWLRAQPFCDGRVAMFGASYVGATQVLAAAEDPEGLVAISPQLTTARHGETWAYRGGAVELGFLLLWIIEALGPADLDRRLAVPEAEAAARVVGFLDELRRTPHAAFARLPVLEPDLVALAPYAERWFDTECAAQAAQDREHLDQLAACRAAMLVTGGWNDLFVEGSLELFETAAGRGGGADRLIVGPWSHGNPMDWQGGGWHGYGASTAGLSEAQLDFFEDMFGDGSPQSPTVRYFRTGSDSWHEAPAWPLPGRDMQALYLNATELSDVPAQQDWARDWIADPLDPVPTVGGATFLPGLLHGRNSGPMDQREIEVRDDVLIFTGAPLTEALEVTGLVRVHIHVGTSAPSADWTARLCMVDRDGRSLGLVDGITRWSAPETPEEMAPVEIRLGHVSHLFAAGSRIRLQLASSNFPRFDRNPQTGGASCLTPQQAFQRAHQHVFGGPDRRSCLILPVVGSPFPQRAGI